MNTRGVTRKRAPVTPKGLELMEKGELEPFDPEIYPNLNTGVLEEYMEDKNRKRSFGTSGFRWTRLIILVILVGIPFTFITQYIALKAGMVLSSVFYVSYIVGVALRWKPREVNIVSSATNLVDQTVVGFVYVFPAIFLLARSSSYFIDTETSTDLEVWLSGYRLVTLTVIVSLFTSLLSLFYFIVFRRLWIVEDPLPTPGFESLVKLMDIANSVSMGLKEKSRNALRKMGIACGAMFAFAFIRDFPPNPKVPTIMSNVFEMFGIPNWFNKGYIQIPLRLTSKTSVSFSLSGIAFSIGWYMRWKTALTLLLGSLFIWFFVVPLAIYTHSPFYWAPTDVFFDVSQLGAFWGVNLSGTMYEGIPPHPIWGAFTIAKNIAIGALLGAGLTSIVKLIPMLKLKRDTGIQDCDKRDRSWISGRGWYEWPRSHIAIVVPVSLASIFLTLWLIGGFHILSSFLMSLIIVGVGFFLIAMSVKIAGEAGIGPTIGIITIFILITMVVLRIFSGWAIPASDIIVITVIGTTAFGASISIPMTVLWDYKTAHYIGTRPYQLFRAQSVAFIFGIPFSAFIAYMLSERIVSGDAWFYAPQANAFASFISILAGGYAYWTMIGLGVVIGFLVELMTARGTVFGLGMFFPVGFPAMIFTGGVVREWWERRLKRIHGAQPDWGEKKTIALVNSYLIMTGIFVGEGLVGLVISMYILFGG